MAQELLTECVHLVDFYAPHIYVRDIATASKPWGCLNLEDLTIYIVKQPEDEAEWEDRVFEQIGKLCQLVVLDLCDSCGDDDGGDDDGDDDDDDYEDEHHSKRTAIENADI
ncbi:hypothetical protein BGZ96_006061 [Linnemannia gamsii]|uniref:Uncharacterized protein n=1 Tax=Linnemannia gamsii TaxID=64522 RepID=A0ABQ7K5I1_9FUNG|nr:hypothetical protein BGZ96_006061 [Linnemannia gamsii]